MQKASSLAFLSAIPLSNSTKNYCGCVGNDVFALQHPYRFCPYFYWRFIYLSPHHLGNHYWYPMTAVQIWSWIFSWVAAASTPDCFGPFLQIYCFVEWDSNFIWVRGRWSFCCVLAYSLHHLFCYGIWQAAWFDLRQDCCFCRWCLSHLFCCSFRLDDYPDWLMRYGAGSSAGCTVLFFVSFYSNMFWLCGFYCALDFYFIYKLGRH